MNIKLVENEVGEEKVEKWYRSVTSDRSLVKTCLERKTPKSFFGGSDKSDKALVTDVFQGIFCAEMCKLSVIQGNEENVLWTIFRFEISYPTVLVL